MPSMIMKIGAYQLAGLLKNQVSFLYLQACADGENSSLVTEDQQAWLKGALPVSLAKVRRILKEKARTPDHPIVVIASDLSLAMQAAEICEKEKYLNIFVVEQNHRELPSWNSI